MGSPRACAMNSAALPTPSPAANASWYAAGMNPHPIAHRWNSHCGTSFKRFRLSRRTWAFTACCADTPEPSRSRAHGYRVHCSAAGSEADAPPPYSALVSVLRERPNSVALVCQYVV